MNEKTSKTIAITTFLGTILSGLLLVFPEASQAAPPIPISSCTTINAPGDYKLVADLTGAGDCIRINASQVDLKLDGHTITGPGTGSNASGILIIGQTKVDIKGPGVVTNFTFGVNLDGIAFSEVTNVTSTGNRFGFVVNNSEANWFRGNTSTGNEQHGFTLNRSSNNNFLNNVASNNANTGFLLFEGTANQVKANTTNGNGSDGIRVGGGVSTGHTIKDNTANGNGFGIRLLPGATDNTVKSNTAQSNVIFDLVDDNSGCDNNIWRDNIFNVANQTCIQ